MLLKSFLNTNVCQVVCALLSILLFAGHLLLANAASATEYKDNPGILINRSVERQFNPIGEIESTEMVKKGDKYFKSYGTAFLISPCYIITSSHIVFGHNPEPLNGKNYSVIFHVGVSNDAAFFGRTIAIPVKWGNFNLLGTHDWAILKLSTCVGARPNFGWFVDAQIPASQLLNQHVAIAGYAGSTDRGILSFSEGNVKALDVSDLFKYSVSEQGGMSGSPVMMVIGGDLRVVGINEGQIRNDNRDKTEEGTYDDNNTSYFLALSSVFNRPDIKLLIDNDRAVLRSANPRVKTRCFLTTEKSCK